MSYDIFYRHQFLSLPNGTFIPYIEAGCSNLFDHTYDSRGRKREKRARSWEVQRHPFDKLVMTPQEIQTALDNFIHERILDISDREWEPEKDPAKVRKAWGYYAALSIGGASTMRTTAASYINFFAQGVRHAKSVEYFEFVTFGIHPIWHKDMEKAGLDILPSIVCRTGEEAISAADLFQEKYGRSYWGIDLPIWRVESAIRQRPKRVALSKERKEVDKFFMVYIPGHGWSISGRRYAFNMNYGKKFRTEGEAKRRAARLSWLKAEVQRVDQKAFV